MPFPTLARPRRPAAALALAPPPAAPAFASDAGQEAQIRDIVAHMTLAQKVGQMTQAGIRAITPDEVRQYYIGSVLDGGGVLAEPRQARLVRGLAQARRRAAGRDSVLAAVRDVLARTTSPIRPTPGMPT